ncbi:MAG: adenine deaminase, partial [Bulleidia sp.]|nr:adenine deaminase [Erysipelotrichaceae bacterium]MDY2781595.1 adenine deaminase [Bulleidia sp.]
MMRVKNNRKELIKAALGLVECDLAIKNAQLLNVFTGEVYPATVFVYDGAIAHVEYRNLEEGLDKVKVVVDAEGKYLIPGLIDAHMHIESSMLTPRNFAKVSIPSGTTTIVMDPHEIGNVYGVEGVKYMHDSGEGLPQRQFVDIPSCVPAVPGCENAGAEFFAKEIEELAELKRVIGLAEVMDYIGVINQEDRMADIIHAAERKGLYLQGHAPFVSGRDLSAYLIGGPVTDHESRTGEEAIEKLRSGMFIDSRESSITHNVKDIWEGVKHCKFFDHYCLCTDDREADDLLHEGHINYVVNAAIKYGMDPITAIKSATLNTAREINVTDLGAIAPGYVADMLLVEDLSNIHPTHVFFEGKLVAQDGKLLQPIEDKEYEIETRNSVQLKELSLEDFHVDTPVENGKVKVNVMVYPNLELSSTYVEKTEFEVKDGSIVLPDDDYKFVIVLNRYGKGTIGKGIVKGFGTKKGALASTVSHDSHNLTVVYDNEKDALLIANTLKECGGGMCAAYNGTVLSTLPLPLAGLMSLKSAEELSVVSQKMKQAIVELGLTDMENPLLRIVTLALPVIPEVKMSDLGLVDVLTKKIIP